MGDMTSQDMEGMIQSWMIALRDEGKSKNTIAAYADSARALIRYQDTTGRYGLTRDAVNGFLGSILDGGGRDGTGGQASTANLRARCLRLFSAWAYAEGRTDTDELAGMKAPKPAKKVVPKLADDELAALIKACEKDRTLRGRRDEAMIRLATETTARCDEMLSMDLPGDLSLKLGRAIVRKGKGDKQRIVPFGPHAARALDRYLYARRKAGWADEGPLWVTDRQPGRPSAVRLSYAGMRVSLLKRAKAAGIEGFHPHRLRHTAASRWLKKGGSEGGLMKVAGWSSRTMLDRYVEDTAAERAIEEAQRLNLGEL